MVQVGVGPVRHLVVVLGDQLDVGSAAFDGFDPQVDRVWLAEGVGEARHMWASQPHSALFLRSRRHFRDRLSFERFPVDYRRLEDPENHGTLGAELQLRDLRRIDADEQQAIRRWASRLRAVLVSD